MKKKTFLLLIVLISIYTVSCFDTNTSSPGDIDINLLIGSWIDTNDVIIFDSLGNVAYESDSTVYNFYSDNTYNIIGQTTIPFVINHQGSWTYDESSSVLTFVPNVSIDSIYGDFYINYTWLLLSLDEQNLEVNQKAFRKMKIVDNPFTGEKDTIKPIDLTLPLKLSKI